MFTSFKAILNKTKPVNYPLGGDIWNPSKKENNLFLEQLIAHNLNRDAVLSLKHAQLTKAIFGEGEIHGTVQL